MKKLILKSVRIIIPLIFSSLITVTAIADYVAGEQANKNGDRDTAFKEFYTAANNRDIRSYGKLGSMYLYGLGTEKNFHKAYIWFQMAYLGGEKEGERFRNAASSMLSRDNYLKAVEAAEVQRIKLNLSKTPADQ